MTTAPPVSLPPDAAPEDLLRHIARLREQARTLQRDLQAAEAQLNALFDSLQTDRLSTPLGDLVRLSTQPPRFIIEL